VDALNALQDPQKWAHARDDLVWMWSGGNSELARRIRQETSGYGQDMWARAAREIGSGYRRNANPLKAFSRLEPAMPVLHLYAQPRAAEYLEAQEDFARRHSWFQVKRLATASHFPGIESPETVARHIAEFVTERAGAAG
jgi:pimeloyl-ACP methyl ester carboxylesterase